MGYISELMEKRRAHYEGAADLAVETDGKTVAQICGELMDRLALLDWRGEG